MINMSGETITAAKDNSSAFYDDFEFTDEPGPGNKADVFVSKPNGNS